MNEDRALGELILELGRCTAEEQAKVFAMLSETDRRAIAENWWSQAHPGQREPDGREDSPHLRDL